MTTPQAAKSVEPYNVGDDVRLGKVVHSFIGSVETGDADKTFRYIGIISIVDLFKNVRGTLSNGERFIVTCEGELYDSAEDTRTEAFDLCYDCNGDALKFRTLAEAAAYLRV